MRFPISWFAFLLFLCFRCLVGASLPPLPAPVNMNQDAGCYNLLFVTLHLQNGKELPFVVDTGCPITAFDDSLTPELGKCLDIGTVSMQGGAQESGLYAAPKLYLGKTQLITGSNVCALDFSWLSSLLGRPFMGILGMDCLSNYCVQLDFKAGKMRFLDPAHLDVPNLGKVFPLVWGAIPGDSVIPSIRHSGLLGGTNGIIYIDVGDDSDGEVQKSVLKERGLIKGHYAIRALKFLISTFMGVPFRVPVNQCAWDGETYTDLGVLPARINRFGLSFLARHIVTFDFPGHKLYLKQISVGPRQSKLSVQLPRGPVRVAAQLLLTLENNDRLPGWSRDDEGTVDLASCSRFIPEFGEMKEGTYLEALSTARLESITVVFQKNSDATIYHYTISRPSPESDWQFQKAWQTDANGVIIKEYPIQ